MGFVNARMVATMDIGYCKRPCAECPWRRDVPVGRFPPERFRALAGTAYDIAGTVFACHKTEGDKTMACAGFILQQGAHNMALRMAIVRAAEPFDVKSEGLPLFPNYRAMAIANGVRENDDSLRMCRDDGQTGEDQ